MKKFTVIISIVLLLSLVLAGTALAITDGELDGGGHPNVGLMVALDGEGNPLWRCSGTSAFSDCILDCRALHRGSSNSSDNLCSMRM